MAIKDTMRGGANAGRGDNPHPQVNGNKSTNRLESLNDQSTMATLKPENQPPRWDSNALNAKKGKNTGDPETEY
jgi:hypothetical protein